MERQDTFISLTSASFAHGWKDIGAAFGVSAKAVRQWKDEGAPVVMVTPSVPCVSIGELWEWLKGRECNQPSPLPVKVSPQGPERRETGKDESGKHKEGKSIWKTVSALIARVWEPCAGMGRNTVASGAGSLSPGRNWGKANTVSLKSRLTGEGQRKT